VVDERMELLQQFIIGGEHLMIPNDDYFESLVDLFKEQDIALVLQNVCEHLVSKQIPKDV
jgi:metal-dependent hydrolase (beta-lactamase superfamily II)